MKSLALTWAWIGFPHGRALNREFYRFSVGGLYDVAEIKGK